MNKQVLGIDWSLGI